MHCLPCEQKRYTILLTKYVDQTQHETKFTEQNLFQKLKSCSRTQKMICLARSFKVHYHVNMSLPMLFNQSHMNPAQHPILSLYDQF